MKRFFAIYFCISFLSVSVYSQDTIFIDDLSFEPATVFNKSIDYEQGHYDGEVVMFRNGTFMRHGKGKMTLKNGEIQEGNFVEWLIDGPGSVTSKTYRLEGNFERGIINGPATISFFKTGMKGTGEFSNFEPKGMFYFTAKEGWKLSIELSNKGFQGKGILWDLENNEYPVYGNGSSINMDEALEMAKNKERKAFSRLLGTISETFSSSQSSSTNAQKPQPSSNYSGKWSVTDFKKISNYYTFLINKENEGSIKHIVTIFEDSSGSYPSTQIDIVNVEKGVTMAMSRYYYKKNEVAMGDIKEMQPQLRMPLK